MEIDDRFVAATPEGVSLEFVVAGLGSRFVAIVLDSILQGAAEAILVIAFFRLIGFSSPTRGYVTRGAVALTTFLVFFGYFVVFESLNAGRSPGKALAGLRVVKVTGGPVGLRASLLRNVARVVDVLPSFYAVGAILILATRNHQRLGDMLAGTLVVRDRNAASRAVAGTAWDHHGQWSAAPRAGAPMAGAAMVGAASAGAQTAGWLPPELAHWDVTGVGDQELAVVHRFLAGRAGYTAEARARLALDLASRLWPRVVGPGGAMDAERFLEAVALVKSVRR